MRRPNEGKVFMEKEDYMKEALKEAKKAFQKEEVPVGAIIVKDEAWRLENCEMYVTLEPCSMCAGALIQARIKKVYIGTDDLKTGACGSVLNLLDYPFNHKVEVEKYILKYECENILKSFFKKLRERNKNEKKESI